jgi:uncharacterized membrane protein YidH (DUF202 family)
MALKGKMDSDKEINDPYQRVLQHLANQRTFLAWLRTSVAVIGLGFIVSRFGLLIRTIILGHHLSVTAFVPLSAVVGSVLLHLSQVKHHRI